jgi:signal transduction histidine kinase
VDVLASPLRPPWQAAFFLVPGAALWWRRRAPLVVLAVVLAGLFGFGRLHAADAELFNVLAVMAAMFTVGEQVDPPRTWLAPAVCFTSCWSAYLIVDGRLLFIDAAFIVVTYGGPWLAGHLLRKRAQRVAELSELTASLERARRAEAQQAVVAERTRIARELHDIVAHSLSVVTIQTQAVRRRLGAGHTAEAADLAAVESTARQAMAEMRRLFGVLRAAGEPLALAPQPGLDQLPALVDEARRTGLDVEVSTDGARCPLPPGVDLAAYRVVQEALTNARRHACGASRVSLRLSYHPGELELLVRDNGYGPPRPATETGHGLVGMRERVTLYGGSLTTGPSPGGAGYTVHARIPYRTGG